jgi:hypothetical protein
MNNSILRIFENKNLAGMLTKFSILFKVKEDSQIGQKAAF